MSSRFYHLPPTVQCPLCGSTVLELKPLRDEQVLLRCWNYGEEPEHYGCQYASGVEEKIVLAQALQTLASTIDPALSSNPARLDMVVKDLLRRVVKSITPPEEKIHES